MRNVYPDANGSEAGQSSLDGGVLLYDDSPPSPATQRRMLTPTASPAGVRRSEYEKGGAEWQRLPASEYSPKAKRRSALSRVNNPDPPPANLQKIAAYCAGVGIGFMILALALVNLFLSRSSRRAPVPRRERARRARARSARRTLIACARAAQVDRRPGGVLLLQLHRRGARLRHTHRVVVLRLLYSVHLSTRRSVRRPRAVASRVS
jgi:hypothetical protein